MSNFTVFLAVHNLTHAVTLPPLHVTDPAVVTPQCCPQVFLSSRGELADRQSAVLGIYTLTNQKIANNSHPIYVKHEAEGRQSYLYFREKGSATSEGYPTYPSPLAQGQKWVDPGRDPGRDIPVADSAPRGWIISPELLDDSFYITTKNNALDCPAGLFGGYNQDNQPRDDTFSIECHSDQVRHTLSPSHQFTISSCHHITMSPFQSN